MRQTTAMGADGNSRSVLRTGIAPSVSMALPRNGQVSLDLVCPWGDGYLEFEGASALTSWHTWHCFEGVVRAAPAARVGIAPASPSANRISPNVHSSLTTSTLRPASLLTYC